jgi:hypothetical protein
MALVAVAGSAIVLEYDGPGCGCIRAERICLAGKLGRDSGGGRICFALSATATAGSQKKHRCQNSKY